jgi:hypothetical protein
MRKPLATTAAATSASGESKPRGRPPLSGAHAHTHTQPPTTLTHTTSRTTLDRQLLELINALEDCTDPSTGRDVSATFELAPDPEEYPDYYDAVCVCVRVCVFVCVCVCV